MTEVTTMSDSLLLKIDSSTPDTSAVTLACNALNDGELVVVPTETLYGILSRVDNTAALEKLFELKGRDRNKPLSIFVKKISQLKDYAEMSPVSELIAGKFLPGPLTLVLRSKMDFGKLITREGKTGFRLSANPLIQKILDKIEVPVTATSANFSGSAANESAMIIKEKFGSKIAVYLDGGRLNNPASTVVEVIDDKVNILREGAISKTDILAAIR
ncbi:MAG: threonylcarbamoyl-AMP synthase [candidate division Zixibacteria bacterium]|nr:threonylcarbamoyl-AMP synthase [candidate division Zixibacteria bacterium]